MTIRWAWLAVAPLIAGCTINTDRSGYADAWYYERLTPYYENTLSTRPRIQLRAVRELVGETVVQPDGTVAHYDTFLDDIEIFFASSVTNPDARLDLARRAIVETCPETDVSGLRSLIAFESDLYVVFQGVPCLGHAT